MIGMMKARAGDAALPLVAALCLMAVQCLVLAVAGAAQAADTRTVCYVDKIKLSSDNSGLLEVMIKYKSATDGQMRYYVGAKGLATSQSRTFNLANYEGSTASLSSADAPLAAGEEVWLSFSIYAGEDESCKRDKYKLVYDPSADRTMKFKVKGGTLKGNRCRYDGDIASDCRTSLPPPFQGTPR
jgi:hypothetical protein